MSSSQHRGLDYAFEDNSSFEPSVTQEKVLPQLWMKHAINQLFGDRTPSVDQYVQILSTDGILHGLMGPRERNRLWDRHILNSAVIEEIIPEGSTVLDIGSGAGLPGIPLAIARPDICVTLLEPLLRRTRFLDRVVAELDLNVRVVRGRAEDSSVQKSIGEFDVVTSRALAPLGKVGQRSRPFVRKGGMMAALKGISAPEELLRDEDSLRRLGFSSLSVVDVGQDLLEDVSRVVVAHR